MLHAVGTQLQKPAIGLKSYCALANTDGRICLDRPSCSEARLSNVLDYRVERLCWHDDRPMPGAPDDEAPGRAKPREHPSTHT